MNAIPSFKEDHISQIPALQLLQRIGWTYLTPENALALRGGRPGSVILRAVLEEQLRKMNRIQFKGQTFPFSDANIKTAVQALEDFPFDGLVRTNQRIYDLLCLGKSLPQMIHGDQKSFPLRYVDFGPDSLANNVFHCTAEFVVERTGSHETRRPDIVLFVNGIPLAVIECKRPDIKAPLDEAISQMIRNQRDDEIPKLFLYSQLVLGLTKNDAMYGTTATAAKFWAAWKERKDVDKEIAERVHTPVSALQNDALFSDPFRYARPYFESLEAAGKREITPQDRALYALCRPERLLELMFNFILFDAGDKKVARYQQYSCVHKMLERLRSLDAEGRRQGGVVWHTQGSGKSLTMVMLGKAIALEPGAENHKIVLVTDRVDLDDQIYKTFHHCGHELEQATTGKHLVDLIEGHKSAIITTVIDKFEAALRKKEVQNPDRNIFVLVDEGHRTQYGPLHAMMRKVLPNACYIGFTGTPVMKKDKSTLTQFGGLIDTYTIREAVADKAVVPLLYEGRDLELSVDAKQIDSWFEKVTANLAQGQVADLKKKYAAANQLGKAEQRVKRIAWDIGAHFRENWQGTPFKAQLVSPDKATALKYKQFLDEFGMVTSAVLISAPDMREGYEDVQEETKEEVIHFWKNMMEKYGAPDEYQRQLISGFRDGEMPEIIIVVDKLLTGFDAPRNTVLYLCKPMEGHTLLQAIARVNRLHAGKDFGYIVDYQGVLSELNQALDLYGKLPEFAQDDLAGTLTDIADVVKTLPQRYSELWDVFKGIRNTRDEEEFERLLAEQALRDQFYERLSGYARVLAIALSTVKFIEDTPRQKIEKYKTDLRFFMNLRTSVRRRYGEAVDFKEYERKIQKLVDSHVGAGEVEPITELVNIFDKEAFAREVEKAGSSASKADLIAYRTKKTISEKWQEDPAFYKRFSQLLEEAIEAFRQRRLSDAEYLKRVIEIMQSVVNRTGDDIPAPLRQHDVAIAFYGVIVEKIGKHEAAEDRRSQLGAEVSLGIDEIICRMKIVNWETNTDVQNQMRNRIEDYLFELKDKHSISLDFGDMDGIMEQCLDIAKVRYRT
jgi:type I restriction enzyme, R subunit